MSRSVKIILFSGVVLFIALLVAFAGADKTLYLHAPLSDAHERLEADCAACHEPWSGPTDEKCLACHSRNLAQDTHNKKVLENPQKAKPINRLVGAKCVDCHREHQEVKTSGYTGPESLCVRCHPQESLPPGRHFSGEKESCQKAGCHRYHTNLTQSEIVSGVWGRLLEATKTIDPEKLKPYKKLSEIEIATMRADPFYNEKPAITSRFEISKHNGTEATCARCHNKNGDTVDLSPSAAICLDCHKTQTKTFLTGAHGAKERSPSGAPGLFGHETGAKVTCGSCHDSHSLRLEEARITACNACHESTHSKSYYGSGHYRYLSDPIFASKKLKGVDCAGCHMPRLYETFGATDHNESLSVSTKEKMARTVCTKCHGLYFSLASLYNDVIVSSNFTYSPKGGPDEIEYAFRGYTHRQRKPVR